MDMKDILKKYIVTTKPKRYCTVSCPAIIHVKKKHNRLFVNVDKIHTRNIVFKFKKDIRYILRTKIEKRRIDLLENFLVSRFCFSFSWIRVFRFLKNKKLDKDRNYQHSLISHSTNTQLASEHVRWTISIFLPFFFSFLDYLRH